MLTPFRLGVGGRVGSGRQWMSWIHVEDVASAIRFAIDNSSLSGPVNATAPAAVPNAEFTKTLGRVLRRPTLFPAPGFAMHLAFGEMAGEILLGGQRVLPRKLAAAGFTFRFPTLEPALRNILLGTPAAPVASGAREGAAQTV